MMDQFKTALLSIFSDKTSGRTNRNIDWIFKHCATEVDSTTGFFRENEIPISGVLCFTPNISYYIDHIPPRGILWLTSDRLVYVYKTGGGLFKTPESHFMEFEFSSLASVQPLFKGTIVKEFWIVLHISTTAANGKVANISFKLDELYYKEDRKELLDVFINSVQQRQKMLENKNTSASPQDDLLGKLAQLDKFRQDGILTDEEFKAAKMRLLDM